MMSLLKFNPQVLPLIRRINHSIRCIYGTGKNRDVTDVDYRKLTPYQLEKMKDAETSWKEGYESSGFMGLFPTRDTFIKQPFLEMLRKVDWSKPGAFRKFWRDRGHKKLLQRQKFVDQRHRVLGSDLSAAHFVVFMGGKAKFMGSSKWVQETQAEEAYLPNKFVEDLYLEALDASNTDLTHEGLVNFLNLPYLQWLSFRNCKYIDDFCLGKMSTFGNALQYLDLSQCPHVTENGLSSLHSLRKLKVLRVEDMPAVPEKELEMVCLLLQDLNPNLVCYRGSVGEDKDLKLPGTPDV